MKDLAVERLLRRQYGDHYERLFGESCGLDLRPTKEPTAAKPSKEPTVAMPSKEPTAAKAKPSYILPGTNT